MSRRLGVLMTLMVCSTAIALTACSGSGTPSGPVGSGSAPPTGSVSPSESVSASSSTTTDWPESIGGFNKPTSIVAPAAGSDVLYVTEQRGVVRLVRRGHADATPALDIRREVGSDAAERGLLCIAFPPGYETKGYAYLDFTDTHGDTRICRVHRSATDPQRFDPATLQTVLRIAQPYANHNGGQIVFGPDGYLYIGMGDGGSARDPQNRAQNKRQLLGKILRIDTESAPDKAGYGIPNGNPFAGLPSARPEIWLYGLRNPWRFSFDAASGDMWIADVGQDAWEEVDVVPPDAAGANLGWSLYEGDHLMKASRMVRKRYRWPVAEYSHSEGASITGGYVYRGSRYPGMQGLYVFGDFESGRIWTLQASAPHMKKRLAASTNYSISTFGVDGDGEMWVADWNRGVIHRIGDLSR